MRLQARTPLIATLLGAALICSPARAVEKSADEEVRIGTLSGAFLAARTAEIDNDLESAIRFYQTALSLDAENKKLAQSLMTLLVLNGRIDVATPYAEQLKAEPEAERFSRLLLAVNAINAKQFRSSETLLKLALQSDLDRLISQVMTAWVKFAGKDADGAIAHLEGLEGPGWYNLFTSYHKAMIADAAGMAELAEQFYSVTAELAEEGRSAPDTYLRFVEAHARFVSRGGDRTKALEVLGQADAVVSRNPRIESLTEKLSGEAALKPMAVNARQGSAEILLNLGTAINRPGSGPFALYYLRLADALRPDNDATLLQLASHAEALGKAEQAIEFYQRVADDSPLKRVSELQLGLNLADVKKFDDAEKHLQDLINAQPDDVRSYQALGSVYSAQEDYNKLAGLLDRAASVFTNPTREHWNIFYQRGIAYERIKQWEKAEPNFLKALELYPDQPQVLNYLGYSWVDMNMRLEEGLDLIRKAVELRPRDGYIVDSLGWAYYRLGRFEDAVTELERSVSLKPDDPVINDHLGDAYWRAGRKLEATFQWRHARDMKPDEDIAVAIEKKLAEGLPPLKEGDAVANPEEPAKPDADTKG